MPTPQFYPEARRKLNVNKLMCGWLAAPIPHTNARTREPDSRPSTPGDTPKFHKPPPLRHSGIIADWDVILRKRQSPSGSLHQKAPVGTNPANFAYTFGAVDSPPEPVPCSGMDIFHFHWSQLSHQWTPQRTLDPSHIPTTSTSTSWATLRHSL